MAKVQARSMLFDCTLAGVAEALALGFCLVGGECSCLVVHKVSQKHQGTQ